MTTNVSTQYVVRHQYRKHHSPTAAPDGVDRVTVETRDGVATILTCPWAVVTSIHELGAEVAPGEDFGFEVGLARMGRLVAS